MNRVKFHLRLFKILIATADILYNYYIKMSHVFNYQRNRAPIKFTKLIVYCIFSRSQQSNVATIRERLLKEITPVTTSSGNKVTIVGSGMVGMTTAFSILTHVSSNKLVAIDGCLLKCFFFSNRISLVKFACWT